MPDEEDVKQKKLSYQLGQPTDEMSVEEMVETICELKEEIEKLEKIKNQKSEHLSAANSLFKS